MAQVYRFFPWTRRGLVAGLPIQSPPPVRGQSSFKVTVTADIMADRSVTLMGPGDVVGIDHRMILGCDPKPASHDMEPNFLVSIAFDAPDFPWLFTPSSAGPDQRLAPWLVLVVLKADTVEGPSITQGRPLPWIKLKDGLPATELPDLADSWAWAHAQRLTTDGDRADAAGLTARPDLNLSRLICPRRLEPAQNYIACLVPAWDAGRDTGLGLPRTNPDAPLAPAWTAASLDLILPIYHHWTFQTGENGDFESLARRLKPMIVSAQGIPSDQARMGRVYLGTADGTDALRGTLPPEALASMIRFDAALEATDRPLPDISQVPVAFAQAAQRAINPSTTEALLPPIYGDRHARRDAVALDRVSTDWLDEVNLDPRCRLDARLGGDVVRQNQEDLMQIAWEQVGDVLAANAQLARSDFLATVAVRALARHTAKLSPDRFLMVTSVLHARTRVGDVTLTGQIAATSLPDRAFDMALRRMTSPVGRVARMAARATPGMATVTKSALSRSMAMALQRDTLAADPSEALRPGIFEQAQILDLTPRADLAVTGMVTEQHLILAADIADQTGQGVQQILELARDTMRANPDALQLVVPVPSPGSVVQMLAIVQRRGAQVGEVQLGTLDARGTYSAVLNLSGAAVKHLDAGGRAAVLNSLSKTTTGQPASGTVTTERGKLQVKVGGVPVDLTKKVRGFMTFGRDGARPAEAGPVGGPRRAPNGRGGIEVAAGPMFVGTLPPLQTTGMDQVLSAFQDLSDAHTAPITASFRPAALADTATPGMATLLRRAIDPTILFARRAAMIVTRPNWLVDPATGSLDQISAAPRITLPFADLLAKLAPERLLPAEVVLPDNSITLLSPNPRFVAAFMIGANHEMNRELLWRSYPTDSRGTPITRFWNWAIPETQDVQAIHNWPRTGPLAGRLANATSDLMAVVVRGRLLRRYPNTHLLAWKIGADGHLATLPDDPNAVPLVMRPPAFKLQMEPDITVVGFGLSPQTFVADKWSLVFLEPVTEARFGLDDNGGLVGVDQDDPDWSTTGVLPGQHLPPSALAIPSANGGAVAGKLLQKQFRYVLHSSELAAII